MRYKGYDAQPLGAESIHGETAWYFYFEVPEGMVELEVEYGPADDGFATPTWRCQATEFWVYDEMPDGWEPSAFVQQQLDRAETLGG